MPSAFIAATASPRAFLRWACTTWRGSSSVASSTESTSRAYVGEVRSSSSSAATANGDSGWLRAKSGCRSIGEPHLPPVGLGHVEALDDVAGEQRAVDRDGPPDVPQLRGARLVVVLEQLAHRGERVARAAR